MALLTSTGLRDHLLDTGSVRTALDLGFINIYSGTPPATADAALDGGTNVLLCQITVDAVADAGISFATDAASGSLAKAPGEVWRGINADSGVATFYRHVAAGDVGDLNTIVPRLQGSIATAGAEMNLSNTTLNISSEQKIDYYLVNLPTA